MNTILKWGIIAAVGLISSFTVHFSTYTPNAESPFGKFFFMAAIFFLAFSIFFGLKKIKQDNINNFKIEFGLKSGLKIVLIGGLITALYLFVFFKWINPEILTAFFEINQSNLQALLADGTMSQEVYDQQIEGFKSFYAPFNQSSMSLMIMLFAGSFFTLITTILLKKLPI